MIINNSSNFNKKNPPFTNPLKRIFHKGNEFTVYPDRGGIITSIKINGTELLYQDMYNETLFDCTKSVRGGMPYMFPNAGPLNTKEMKKSGLNLPQHGIGRVNKWEQVRCNNESKFIQKYDFSKSPLFPFKGNVTNTIRILKNGFHISHIICNEGLKNMPISTGIHPYFRVPEGCKGDIKWNFVGGEKIKKSLTVWENSGTVTFDNPGIPFEISIPGLGILLLEASSEYSKFWVWSIFGKNFVCIEPVMGENGGIINNPIIVEPGKINMNSFKIFLKQTIDK